MKFTGIAVVLLIVNASPLTLPKAAAELIPSADGNTVYDTILKVNWLVNANLPGSAAGQFGVSNINPSGSMSYNTAVKWVAALNAFNSGAGYLGQNTWTLPTSPTYPALDTTCSSFNKSGGGSFGSGCEHSAMGSLFYHSLGLNYPNTAVPIPNNTVGPFSNFQPYLYWSATPVPNITNGYDSFSFNTGWQGSNVDSHYMYVLPMIPGKMAGTYVPAGYGTLQVSADGQTVYDPGADVTWLANANLAATQTFGSQCVNPDGTQCINPDGSMTHTVALNWITGMNAYNAGAGWLGQTNWQMPPTIASDQTCSNKVNFFGFGCTGSPLGELFYNQLGLSAGTPVVAVAKTNVGPFQNPQPYLYWSCGVPSNQTPCEPNGEPPAAGFGWSFSFGNGFQGTDVVDNELYATAYYPETPTQAAFGITAIQRLSNGHIVLSGVGAPNYTYSVQKSPDLATAFTAVPGATPLADPLGNLQYRGC